MWYTRDRYLKGDVEFLYMNTGEIPADKLTKLASKMEHRKFASNVMGLDLLPYNYFELNDKRLARTEEFSQIQEDDEEVQLNKDCK